jgi:hypothetical protein
MKKNIISIFFFLVLSTAMFAQNKYISLQYGYSAGMNSTFVTEANVVYSTTGSYTGTLSNKNLALGQGGTGALSFGCFLTNNVGFELAVSSFVSSDNKITLHEVHPLDAYSNVDYVIKANYRANSIAFAPSLIISTDIRQKYTLYNRCGLLLAYSTLTADNDNTATVRWDRSNMTLTKSFVGNIRLGFVAALGGTYQLNKKLTAFGELQVRALSFVPTKSTITKYVLNGEDNLSELSTSQKETVFKDEVNNAGTSLPSTQPSVDLKQTYSLSGVGLSVGLRYNL